MLWVLYYVDGFGRGNLNKHALVICKLLTIFTRKMLIKFSLSKFILGS